MPDFRGTSETDARQLAAELSLIVTEVTYEESDKAAGTVVSLEKGNIYVATGDGVVGIDGVLPEGKGRMKSLDFVNGRKIAVGDVFTLEK